MRDFTVEFQQAKTLWRKENNAYGEKVIILSVKIMVCDRFGYRID